MSISANWNYPTAIKFGAGRIKELPDHVKALGMKRPLLVTDKALGELPITKNALQLMLDAGLEAALFSDVKSNPTEENLSAGLAVYRAGKHDADL